MDLLRYGQMYDNHELIITGLLNTPVRIPFTEAESSQGLIAADLANHQIRISKPGMCLVSIDCSLAHTLNDSETEVYLVLYKNRTPTAFKCSITLPQTSVSRLKAGFATLVYMNKNDFLEVYVFTSDSRLPTELSIFDMHFCVISV